MSLKDRFLDLPLVGKTRRVHAIEHATITLLSQRHPNTSMAGRSNSRGFWFYGDIDEKELVATTKEAIAKLQGQPTLAIHPNCGTNMAVSGVMTGAAAFLASLPWHANDRKIDRLPRAIIAATFAALFSQPAGLAVQKGYTTSPAVEGLTVGKVKQKSRAGRRMAFVEIQG
ncbi:MAG: hypothetical protein KDD73_06115 [Anaerolineales bacterium]|nr:hypothetical protein [Anaerolineales bacterium]MCB9129277.1 hypothetical protein [Ardenticatenales bacterium]